MKIEDRQKFLLILTIAVVALYAGDMLVFEPSGNGGRRARKTSSRSATR